MAPDPKVEARPSQHRVLRQITERFGRLIEHELKECLGRAVPVRFEYQGDSAKKTGPHLTLICYWVERMSDRQPDRDLQTTGDGSEFFRNPPLMLTARFLLTAWAPPPEDQELLICTTRVLHDLESLGPDGEGDEDAIHWEDEPTIDMSQRFSIDEASAICESYGMPLRPSLRYDISFRVDSEKKTPVKRVRERIVDYKKLDG